MVDIKITHRKLKWVILNGFLVPLGQSVSKRAHKSLTIQVADLMSFVKVKGIAENPVSYVSDSRNIKRSRMNTI